MAFLNKALLDFKSTEKFNLDNIIDTNRKPSASVRFSLKNELHNRHYEIITQKALKVSENNREMFIIAARLPPHPLMRTND